jgi:hypothetical protein
MTDYRHGPMNPVRGSGIFQSGLMQPGNIDLNNRPRVQNADGTISTVRSMSYRNSKGEEVLIPTVSDEGAIMTPQDAIRYWGLKNMFLGKFANPEQADAYAEWLHNQQAKQYGGGQ